MTSGAKGKGDKNDMKRNSFKRATKIIQISSRNMRKTKAARRTAESSEEAIQSPQQQQQQQRADNVASESESM